MGTGSTMDDFRRYVSGSAVLWRAASLVCLAACLFFPAASTAGIVREEVQPSYSLGVCWHLPPCPPPYYYPDHCPPANPPYEMVMGTYGPDRLNATCVRWVSDGNNCPAHASGNPCVCDQGYVFNSAKTACVTLQLSVAASPPFIPKSSSVQNRRVLTQSDLALTLAKGNEPAGGVTIKLKAIRQLTSGTDTINGPKKPTDAQGAATADVVTRDQPATSVVMASDTSSIQTVRPGAVNWLPADYQSGFSISCYTLSQESEFSANRLTRGACGLPRTTYRSAFLNDVSVQGSGIGLDGRVIRYQGKRQGRQCFRFDTCAHTASGRCAIVGMTIAVDPRIIPLGDSRHLGSQVNIQILGSRYAQDTGGDIKGYKIDNYVGVMPRATCMRIGRNQSQVTFLNY